MTNFLIVERNGPILTLTMNQPEQRNALTGNTAIAELLQAVTDVENDTSIRCVILTGNGPAFSAGGDIRQMKRQASPQVSEMAIRQEYRKGIQSLTLALFGLEVPVIAAVNGHAIGAGLDLACMCDLRIASSTAKFAESFVKVGIIPGDGGAWLLPRIVGLPRTAELSFTGDAIDAQTALEWNLVSRVVPPEDLLSAANALAERIVKNPSHALRLAKRLLREAMHSQLDTVLELSAAYQAICHKTPDHMEAVNAFLEKRPPNFN